MTTLASQNMQKSPFTPQSLGMGQRIYQNNPSYTSNQNISHQNMSLPNQSLNNANMYQGYMGMGFAPMGCVDVDMSREEECVRIEQE